MKPCDHTGKPLEVCPCKSCKGWRKLMRAKNPAEMVERLRIWGRGADNEADLDYLKAADLIESQASRIAELERCNELLRESNDSIREDLAAARDMIRDLCIGHRDNCVCRCCESVFRIDAKGE